MAESAEEQQIRNEWYELLAGVKKTVEGLLAAPTTNVWSTYGGLNRLRNSITRILNHRLKVTQGPYGSVLDYWNFIRGLRYLAPAYAHTVSQMSRLCAASGDLSPGQTWVRQSLLDHSLSAQLSVLVSSPPYLHHHYYYDAYLCQPQYVQALLTCLHAVEENRPALLAELDPALLSSLCHPPAPSTPTQQQPPRKATHVRSASLPVNSLTSAAAAIATEDDMISRRQFNDPLAPPSRSPKTGTVPIGATTEHAKPSIDSSPESAKDALLQVLSNSSDIVERGDDVSFYASSDKISDPLMNIELLPNSGYQSYTHSHGEGRLGKRGSLTMQHQGRSTGWARSHSSGGVLDFMFDSEDDDKENYVRNSNLRSSRLSLTQVDAILESPDHHPANQYRGRVNSQGNPHTFMDVERTGTIIISDHKPKSTDSGVHSPPSRSVLFPTTDLQNLDYTPVQKKPTHTRSTSDIGVFQRQNSLQDVPRRDAYSPDMSSSVPTDYDNRDAYFQQPSKGQSLLSFLSSQDFNTCAELDKENAHFSISEALIAAIEQMKWNQILRPTQSTDDHELMDSDEEIQDLKQQIRIRREVCLKEKARGFPAFCDAKLDTATSASSTNSPTTCSSSSQNASPPSTDSSGEDTSGPDADIIDADINEDAETGKNANNLMTLKQSGLSLSMASLYSDLELQRANSTLEQTREKSNSTVENNNNTGTVSAESVAISLLKRFSEKQLPKASELKWLVTEQDAPQALLPLPNSYPVSPDDNEHSDLSHSSKMTRLRGNLEWAPPRAQIIFNIHPAPKRKVLLAKQNYCCAGCGAKVEPGYMKRYRYCEYLGKYFCPRCHTNALAYIPGRILRKWDFTKYYVSNFACDLLKKMYSDPLFSVEDINMGLYRKVRVLDTAREARVQLQHLQAFLQTCRNGQSMLEEFRKAPTHWTTEIHIYSLDDLVQLKNNHLLPQLRCLVNDAITHVQQCQLCQAKGFICETCNSNDIIYPFELHTVIQCDACKACYHKGCYNPEKCGKCDRIEARRRRLAQITKEPFSESSSESSDDNATTPR